MTRTFQPSELRCYDNGGRSFDRYTILPPRYAGPGWRHNPRIDPCAWICIGASEHPYHPQGFGQHISAHAGPHLGRRVAFVDLPPDVQRFARESFCVPPIGETVEITTIRDMGRKTTAIDDARAKLAELYGEDPIWSYVSHSDGDPVIADDGSVTTPRTFVFRRVP